MTDPQAETTNTTPALLGFYMPAEWRAHEATWLSWPKDPETWPDRVPEVQDVFLQMMAALAPNETVNLLVDDEATEETVRALCTFAGAQNVCCHRIPTVDSWIRDYGPNFLINNQAVLAFNDWRFNAWGNKYEELKKDNAIPQRLESLLKAPRFAPGIVMEGGSIEVNGAGCVLTTEQCLLNPNRNPGFGKAEVEERLKRDLGSTRVVWLGNGLLNDHTDGHVDNLARFVAPNRVAVPEAVDNDPNAEVYADAAEALLDADLEVVVIPSPGLVERDGEIVPASYMNFYIGNASVVVPFYGAANDGTAVDTIQSLFPDRRAVGLRADHILTGGGSFHCISQQVPL